MLVRYHETIKTRQSIQTPLQSLTNLISGPNTLISTILRHYKIPIQQIVQYDPLKERKEDEPTIEDILHELEQSIRTLTLHPWDVTTPIRFMQEEAENPNMLDFKLKYLKQIATHIDGIKKEYFKR
jgi:hypothetical protein